jgi:ParB-like chromosome segregation protein Spo0J
MELKINERLKALIPPLSAEEYAGLKESIRADGCRDAIVTWNGAIVDGHNRYEICGELGIPFRTTERDFENDDAAIEWILQNQLARRNLSDAERGRLALKLKDMIAARAKERQGTRTDIVQNFAQCESGRTREKLAEIAGISRETLRKVEAVDTTAPEPLK